MGPLGIYCICLIVLTLTYVECRVRHNKECGQGWVSMHRACYKFDKRKLTWSEALDSCAEEEGSLVSISSRSELRSVKRELKKHIQTNNDLYWWIGLKWNEEANKFNWQDNGRFSARVTPWNAGEPNNGRGKRDEHCIEFKFNGYLNDRDCAMKRPFICEQHEITKRPIPATVPAVTATSTTIATTAATSTTTPTTTTTTNTTTPTTTTTTTPPTATNTTTTPTKTAPTSTTTPTKTAPTSTTTSTTTTLSTTTTKERTTTKTYSTTQSFTEKTVPSSTTRKTTRMPSKSTTDLPKRTSTLSILTSTTWEEKLNPFSGCYKLSDNTFPPGKEEMLSSQMVQEYFPGSQLCPTAYAGDMVWPATPTGTFATIPCKNGQGNATWRCGSNPTCWRGEPNVGGCASPELKKILTKVQEPDVGIAVPGVKELVTSTLVQVSERTEISVADIMLTSKVIQSLAFKQEGVKTDEMVARRVVKNIVKVGSNLVSENKSSTWQSMATEDKRRSASNLLVAMEKSTFVMAEGLDKPTVVKTEDENIDLELRVIDVNTLGEEEDVVYDDQGSDNVISIPAKTLKSFSQGGLAKAVFMTHYKMSALLQAKPAAKHENGKREKNDPEITIASSILSASLGTEHFVPLPEPITFTMKHTQVIEKRTTAKCSFWDTRFDYGYGRWSEEGCEVVNSNRTHTTCQCNHLTNFAILMDVEGVEINVVHEKLLEFITIVGCIISALCLAASWLTFMCFGSLQGERNSIHKNLVACLFVAEVLFVTGINRTDNQLACSLIAGFLHYFFLCTFMWMLIEGVHMIIMLVQVFDAAKSRLPFYYFTAYGTPLIIIAVSAGFYYQGYGTEKHCWLTTDNFFIWSFAGPVALILLVNAIILTYAMVMVCRHSEYVISNKEKDTSGMRTWIQGALSMEVLLGLTWTFGFFFINMETITLAYVFTILNSLQGLFIFCFHCLLNKKVMKEYKRVLHISKKRQGGSTQSASLIRKQSQSRSQSYDMSSKPTRDSNC